jgi:uncharacterized membrane protein
MLDHPVPVPAASRLPQVRAARVEDIRAALAAGWRDFLAAPLYGLFFGAVYALGGLLITAMLFRYHVSYYAYPLIVGFVLIAPFVATGLYEVSRLREAGQKLRFGSVLSVIWGQSRRELGWMAFVTLFFFIVWMYQARLLLALFLGFKSFSTLPEFLTVIFGSSEGLMFLLVGNLVGAGLSALLFSLTGISFPLLLERDMDFISAMITSVNAVRASPVVMLGWGAVIVAMAFLAMAPAFLGLLIVLPVLGHTTWHLYRRLVAQPDQRA